MSKTQSNKHFFFGDRSGISNRGADVHYHSYFEIYRLTDGGCECFVDDKLYRMNIGDIVIIPPGAIHGTHYTTQKHGRTLINFSGHYVPKSLTDMLQKGSYIYRCDDASEELDQIFSKIEKERRTEDVLSDEVICALMAQLIVTIIRHIEKNDDVILQNSFIEVAVKYIQENYQNPISLADISDACNVSKVHLSRKFKERTGIGLNEYIVLCRLKKARELLLTGDKMSICEIAFGCGFNDSNYFSWLFKKTYGVTPSQYRKNTRD